MKLLREALVDVKRLPNDEEEGAPEDDNDLDVEVGLDDSTEQDGGETGDEADPNEDDVGGFDFDSETTDDAPQPDPSDPNPDADSPWGSLPASGGGGDGAEGEAEDGEGDDQGENGEENQDIDSIADQASDDPNRQGLIRNVRGAHLVYKREGDGGFEELWIYNLTTLQDEMTVRKAILAGTDIPPNKSSSPDGSQTYKVWSAGNAEMLLITGLQN